MFNLSTESIMAMASPGEFEAGREYYKSRRIKSVKFNQERNTFAAEVLGTRLYSLRLRFDRSCKLAEASCDCAGDRGGGAGPNCCRHMIALLLLIKEKDEQGFFRELKFRQAARDVFEFFRIRPGAKKTPVYLEPVFELSRDGHAGKSPVPSLKLRIGQDRMYMVRDVKALLFHMESNLELHFGKQFTYAPSRHEFTGKGLELANMLREIYETDLLSGRLGGGNYAGRGGSGIFREGKVYLTDTYLKRFFKIYEDAAFKAIILGSGHDAVRIKNGDIPVNFILSCEGKDFILYIDFNGPLLPVTGDGEYFCCGGDIYHVSREQSEHLKPFYMAMISQKGCKLRFIEEDKQRFVSEILPFAEKAGNLIISDQVGTMIVKTPLEAEIYLDGKFPEITAEVKFKYGDFKINPFLPAGRTPDTPDKLILRDIDSEESILDILAMADFKVNDGKIHLTGDDNFYDFIFRIVPYLQDYAAVYYSESLKNMKLRTSVSFYAKLDLDTGSGMLEFSFGADGIERSELADIFMAIRQKKKFYRLKNGDLINLGSAEFTRLDDFMENLGIDPRRLENESIEMPHCRGLYLDQGIRDLGIHKIESSHAFELFVRSVRIPEDMNFPVPWGLKGSLRDYQKFGFKWLKILSRYKLGGILADDMGLGKTLQAIALLLSAAEENESLPSLIVVPTSLVFNWCAELDKFAPDLRYMAVAGDRETRRGMIGSLSKYNVIITTYPLIRRDIEHYASFTFKYCILDEAQHIKNPMSRNARSVKMIRAESRFALTGTPMENNLYELWSVFDFVMPGYLYSYRRFEDKFVKPTLEDGDDSVLDGLNRLTKPFMLRRLKKDVLRELPEKIENTIVCELADDQKKLYMAYLQGIKGELDEEIKNSGIEKNRIRILAALTRLRQLCCHPSLFVEDYRGGSGKMQLLEEILFDSIESNHRILLFSQFTGMLQIIRKRLGELGIPCLYLDGSTPAEERGYLVHSFNEGAGKVFLISLKAGGAGLNLTGADIVIHYDPWWNPAVEDQAADRSHRIGQKKAVHVIKLVAKGTIEEKILSLQEKKRNLVDAVIQPGETLLSKMTSDEIMSLFELSTM